MEYLVIFSLFNALGSQLKRDLIVPFRLEPPNMELKRIKKLNILRAFKKETSVFKDWVEDYPHSLNALLNFDMKYSKIAKVVKTEKEFEDTKQILSKHIGKLKEIFTH